MGFSFVIYSGNHLAAHVGEGISIVKEKVRHGRTDGGRKGANCTGPSEVCMPISGINPSSGLVCPQVTVGIGGFPQGPRRNARVTSTAILSASLIRPGELLYKNTYISTRILIQDRSATP